MAARTMLRLAPVIGLVASVATTSAVRAEQNPRYGFEAAAQEITQLFWLADTANLCGWASDEDTSKFKAFAVRFLASHLSDGNALALVSLVTEAGYEQKVRDAAGEAGEQNCGSRRWQLGWVSYKTAADEREGQY